MYGVSIDRSKEPISAKTMIWIAEFSDFEYFYNSSNSLDYITARNQTRLTESKNYDFRELRKLWSNCTGS